VAHGKTDGKATRISLIGGDGLIGRFLLALFLAVTVALAGCIPSRKSQLESVARNWCMIIRAGQVIPVYPLTEDLQPGDMFLVQVPIDRQQSLYEKKGFLPLDNLIARLNPTGYARFYESSFGVGSDSKRLPEFWLSPGQETAWTQAPQASFPSYSFSIRRGGGLNLAVPVYGVAVGLSLLGTDTASASITISDARTYGIDSVSLYRDVENWESKNLRFLANFASNEEKTNYVRVVSRVYLAGELNVSLQDTSRTRASVSGGLPRPVDLLISGGGTQTERATISSYTSNLEKLSSMIASALRDGGGERAGVPRGSITVVSASARSISLSERFARPLVVGYLGFDMKIGPGGFLGSPIPTHAVLTENLVPQAPGFSETQQELSLLLQEAKGPAREGVRTRVMAEIAGEVETIYAMYKGPPEDRPDLFTLLIGLYISSEPPDGPRHRKVIHALKEALGPID